MASAPRDYLVDVDAVERLSRGELEVRAKALRTINAIADVVLAAPDGRDVLGPAVDALAHFTRFPAVALFAFNEATQRLDLLCGRGFSQATLLAGSHLPIEGSLTGIAFQRRELVSSADVGRDPRVEPSVRQQLAREGFSATLSVPLLVGERAVGAMNLIFKAELGLTDDERGMLTSIAKAMAMAMERTRYVRTIEQERQRSEATLRSIGDGVIATDDHGSVTMMNHEAERLTAWAEDESLGRPVEDVFRIRDAKTHEPIENPIARSLRKREVMRLQDRVVLAARDGAEHDITETNAPILDRDANAWGAVLAFQDVTQAQRDHDWLAFMHGASLLLQASLDWETTLKRVTGLAVAWLADVCTVEIVQPDGEIRRVAGAHVDPAKQSLVDDAVRLTRMDPYAREGTPKAIRTRKPVLYDLAGDPADVLRIASVADPDFLRALNALELASILLVPLVAGDRTLGGISFASRRPQRFGPLDVQRAEQLAHCFSLAIENARLHREVQDALATREEFLSLASHELKTPLTALQLDLAALERAHEKRGEPAAAVDKAVSRALKQTRRLAKLSETLVDVTRLSAGSIVLNLETVELRRLAEDTAERCREEAARAECPIELRPGAPLPWCCDRQRIQQAVGAVISNAIRYGKGRPIELTVEPHGDFLARISVTDHGIGIAREDRARIFERFERAVPSRQYAGLGLGLYVAREIVRAHGGSILVASEPDAGSTFTILLPAMRRA